MVKTSIKIKIKIYLPIFSLLLSLPQQIGMLTVKGSNFVKIIIDLYMKFKTHFKKYFANFHRF